MSFFSDSPPCNVTAQLNSQAEGFWASGCDGAAQGRFWGGPEPFLPAGARARHNPEGAAKGWKAAEAGGEEDTVRTRWGQCWLLHSNFCDVNSSFCPTGGWRMSCWRSSGKAPIDPRRWASVSAPAASRHWAWSSTAAICARSASCASATSAASGLPTRTSGGVTSAPRSRKCAAKKFLVFQVRWLAHR